MARHWVASTSRTWLVPIPNATAPNAPCVEVWLSPQAMVIPRLCQSQFRTDNVNHPLTLVSDVEERDLELGRVFLYRVHHLLGQVIFKRPAGKVCGHDVIHGSEGPLGKADGEAALPQHFKGLGAGHLVNQMEADEQLGLPRGQLAHGMRLPDLLQQGPTHLQSPLHGLMCFLGTLGGQAVQRVHVSSGTGLDDIG